MASYLKASYFNPSVLVKLGVLDDEISSPSLGGLGGGGSPGQIAGPG